MKDGRWEDWVTAGAHSKIKSFTLLISHVKGFSSLCMKRGMPTPHQVGRESEAEQISTTKIRTQHLAMPKITLKAALHNVSSTDAADPRVWDFVPLTLTSSSAPNASDASKLLDGVNSVAVWVGPRTNRS